MKSPIYASDLKLLVIGRLGENGAQPVVFNIADWLSEFGSGGTVSLMHKRSTDTDAYLCTITNVDGVITWVPSSGDLACVGYGEAELRYSKSGVVVKSRIWQTQTLRALDPSANPPSPWQSYVDAVAANADRAEDAVDDAEEQVELATAEKNAAVSAKNAAVQAKDDAVTAKNAAVTAKEQAEAAKNASNKVVLVQDTQPTETENKLWLKGSGQTETIYTKAEVDSSLAALSSEINQLKPNGTPTVGQVLRVKTVNADGTFTCEWASL